MEGIIEMWSLCLKDKSAILNPTKKKKKNQCKLQQTPFVKNGAYPFLKFPS